ncbi:hypothetical protein LTR62_008570 [Meristemomyces frigidus]|uniref:Uncharacterized protein n=1 Tax=Meristemomyces frigidus TaxID=1508187 RepID=A0AAN7TMS8_9PEZI|nr:hypothetical protein LTR62_008570 [Meristemomyces frigidus]
MLNVKKSVKKALTAVAEAFHPPLGRRENSNISYEEEDQASSMSTTGPPPHQRGLHRSVTVPGLIRAPLEESVGLGIAVPSQREQWLLTNTTASQCWGDWKPGYSVFQQLNQLIEKMRDGGRRDEGVQEMFEVIGSAMDALLHELQLEKRETGRLGRLVGELEGGVKRVEGGGLSGGGADGGAV